MAYRDTILGDSPVEYWEFNEASGTSSTSTGSSPHSLAHTGTTVVAGRVGNARQYDGVDDVSTASNVFDFMLDGTYSVECWIKWDNTGNDYPTFIRRDGNGKVFIIRGRAATLGDRPGLIETYVSGRTVWSTTRYDDNQWHHVVVTVSGTTVRLFIDNVEALNANGTVSTGGAGAANPTYIGRGSGAGEHYKGALDEFAIYQTTLTPTMISNHYNAGLVNPNTAYAATPMTASATSPNAVITGQVDASYVATPMTAEATTPAATTKIAFVGDKTSLAWSFTHQGNATGGAGTVGVAGLGQTGGSAVTWTALRFANIPAGATLDSGPTLSIKTANNSGGSMVLSIYPILADFTTANNFKEEYVLGTPITFTPSTVSGTVNTVDVSALYDQGQVYGYLLEGDQSNNWIYFEKEYTTTTNNVTTTHNYAPRISAEYHMEVREVSYSADPMTGTAAMADATVLIANHVSVNATALTAVASMPDATVSGEKDATFVAEAMQASAEMPGGFYSAAIEVAAEPFLASAESPEATVSTTLGVAYTAEPMKATARFVQPESVNGNPIESDGADDDYFQRISAQNPSHWIRQTDIGEVIYNRVTGEPMADYRGIVMRGRRNGPEGRASVYFGGGGYIEQREPTATNIDETTIANNIVETALEFSIKTTKANQFILAGADNTVTSAGVASPGGGSEVFMQDGKIGFRSYQYNTGSPSQVSREFVGFKTLNDDEWHHVVVRSGVRSATRDEYGVEIYIDGKLEVRRFLTSSFVGFPDYIASRPAHMDNVIMPVLPSSQNYVGEMSEVVFFKTTIPSTDDATRNYYAFMGWKPFFAEPMEASASMPEAEGKGNRKRALYLYFTGQDEVFGGIPAPSLSANTDHLSYDPNPALGDLWADSSLTPRQHEEIGELMGFDVHTKHVTRNMPLPGNTGGVTAYRDPVTDEQSLINLDSDIDLEDYDVIMFKDWPDEGYERDWFEANYPGQLDRLLEQIKDANENGMELLVTNPRLAIDLGIVDKIEWAPAMTEFEIAPNDAQGRNAFGYIDWKTANDFPWDITSSDGMTGGDFAVGTGQPANRSDSYLFNKKFFYYDTNKNNRFRVRALVEGLTDLPSYLIDKAVWHVDRDEYGWQGAAYKYLNRMNGLQIGDEYIFNGSSVIDPAFLDIVQKRYNRFAGTWATPPGHVKAGVIVTTFGSTLWVDDNQVENPYRDHATTIALEIGTTLNGRTIGGRIFVNFSEQPNQGLGLARQILPAPGNDVQWPFKYQPETAEQQSWEYSWTRTTLRTTSSSPNVQTMQVVNPDGSTSNLRLGSGGSNDLLSMVRSSQLFKVEGLPRLEMFNRGLLWLGSAPEFNEGDVQVRATPMEATASAPQATLAGQKSTNYVASSMIATAQMVEAEEAKSGEVTYLATPMTAEARFTQGGDAEYRATPMTATATAPSVVLTATGDSITLRLPRQKQITLRMETR